MDQNQFVLGQVIRYGPISYGLPIEIGPENLINTGLIGPMSTKNPILGEIENRGTQFESLE